MSDKFVTRDYLLDQFEGYDRSIASQKYATIATVNNKVDKVTGKGLSTNDYDNTAKSIVDNVTTNLAGKVDTSTLSSYYTKTEIDTIVTAVKNGRFIAVSTLPTEDIQTNAIYLVPKSDPDTGDVKDEYINLDGTTSGWERIGSTEIDLSGYVEKSQTAGLLKNDGTVDSTTYAKLANLAIPFSVNGTYDVGVYVSNNNKIYKCTTQHSGAWDAQDFEEIYDVLNEVSTVRYLLSNKADSSTVNAILDGYTIDSFADVETALAGKQDEFDIDSMTLEWLSGVGIPDSLSVSTHDEISQEGIYQSGLPNDTAVRGAVKSAYDLSKDTVGWSGKNELPYPYTDIGNKSDNGITFIDNGDGTITAKAGTASANAQYYIAGSSSEITRSVENIRGKLFSKGFSADGPNLIIWYYDSSKNYISGQGAIKDGVMFNIPNNAVYYSILIRINSGTVLANDVVFKPMIRKADILDSTYEPYFGSTAFPRSEQAVLGAKNLADFTQDKGINSSGEVIDTSGKIATVQPISIISGVQYKYVSAVTENIPLCIYAVWNGSTLVRREASIESGTILNTSGGNKLYVCVYGRNSASVTIDSAKAMLILATDTDSTYVPYAMTNRELTEKKLEVFEINTAVDLNTLTKTGMYLVKNTSTTNRPANTPNQFTLFVMSFSNIFCQQMVIEMTGTKECIYTRRYGGSPEAWSSWYKIEGSAVS